MRARNGRHPIAPGKRMRAPASMRAARGWQVDPFVGRATRVACRRRGAEAERNRGKTRVVSASATTRRITTPMARPMIVWLTQPRAAVRLAAARPTLPGAIGCRPYRALRERRYEPAPRAALPTPARAFPNAGYIMRSMMATARSLHSPSEEAGATSGFAYSRRGACPNAGYIMRSMMATGPVAFTLRVKMPGHEQLCLLPSRGLPKRRLHHAEHDGYGYVAFTLRVKMPAPRAALPTPVAQPSQRPATSCGA